MNKSPSLFASQRLRELREAHRRVLGSLHGPAHFYRIYSLVANSPCSRFWVSPSRAYEVIYALQAGRGLPASMSPLRIEMFLEIHARSLRILADNPRMDLYEAVHNAVHSPAPKFYLSPTSVRIYLAR